MCRVDFLRVGGSAGDCGGDVGESGSEGEAGGG